MEKLVFDALLKSPEDYPNGAYFEFPYNTLDLWETRARVPVKGTVDGYPFRSSLAPMGGCHLLGINQEIRLAIGKKAGDWVHVEMERDLEPRTVSVPDDLIAALKENEDAYENFKSYSYSHQKELVTWIEDAKKADTRRKRIEKAVLTLQGE